MTMMQQWPHKWFGVWKEYGPAYEACPSVHAFVNRDVSAGYDKVRLRRYLTGASIVASTSRRSFPCPFTGKRVTGTISFRTDGRWLWLDDLADYIDQYDVVIPEEFLHDIEKHAYVAPAVEREAMKQLEWPPTKR